MNKNQVKREILSEVCKALKIKGKDIELSIKTLEKLKPKCTVPVIFDIGINSNFLEVSQVEEVKEFYNITNPSPQSLLVVEILIGLLGKWELIQDNVEVTWNNIKNYFQEVMKDNISKKLITYR